MSSPVVYFLTGRSSLFPIDDGLLDDGHGNHGIPGVLGSPHCYPHQNGERIERFSRKVFVGGLPPDIDEGSFKRAFNCYACIHGWFMNYMWYTYMWCLKCFRMFISRPLICSQSEYRISYGSPINWIIIKKKKKKKIYIYIYIYIYILYIYI